jgi:drug/metabolite transporter (DMT)-like permease
LNTLNSLIAHLSHNLKTLPKNTAIFHLIGGAFMISFSGVWVKISHVTPTVSAFYRVLFGGLFLLAAAYWQGEITWKGWYRFLLGFLCGLFLSLDLFFWHQSILYIGPGLATILGNFEVFLLAGLGVVFMGEKVSLKFFLAILMAILGLFLVVGIQWNQLGSQYKTGVYLGLATAVAYTAFLLSLRKLQAGERGGVTFYGMMLVSFASAIFLGLQAVYSGDSFVIPDTQSWAALLLLGLTSQGIGWILISNALPRVRASFAGLILLLQPSLAFIWDVLFFQRPTSVVNWIGVIMAITAIYLGTAQRSDGKKNCGAR